MRLHVGALVRRDGGFVMSDTTYQVKGRPEKAEAVDGSKGHRDGSSGSGLPRYGGLTVNELAELRTALAGAEVSYKVVKNTLAKLAADALGIGDIAVYLEGPTAIAYCNGDPVLGAKALSNFAKDHPALVIKGGV